MRHPNDLLSMPVTLAWVGDLHLTAAGLPNHRTAEWAIEELNAVVRPDMVQFAGDNAQDARPEQFELFNALRERLTVPHAVLVGDHDVVDDPAAITFQTYVGATHGSSEIERFRFVRLNTLDGPPLGMSDGQLDWFEAESWTASRAGQRLVVCQHHYPFKAFEQFEGPGVERWRRIVHDHRPAVVLCGHTHYGQVANDGRCVYVATRSVGDPEGGPPGYALVHLRGEELAITHRGSGEAGPIPLITWPRDALLATGPRHVVSGPTDVLCRAWSREPLVGPIEFQVDGAPWAPLVPGAGDVWWASLTAAALAKGRHTVAVRATDVAGRVGTHAVRFAADPTGRFTATPSVFPIVEGTQFC